MCNLFKLKLILIGALRCAPLILLISFLDVVVIEIGLAILC